MDLRILSMWRALISKNQILPMRRLPNKCSKLSWSSSNMTNLAPSSNKRKLPLIQASQEMKSQKVSSSSTLKLKSALNMLKLPKNEKERCR